MDAVVLTREQAIDRLRSAEAQIRRLGVRRLALFGSVVRNQATVESDVDVLVEFEPAKKTLDSFMELAFLLDEVLGRPADLVTTESLSPYIGPHILREAEDVLHKFCGCLDLIEKLSGTPAYEVRCQLRRR